MSRFGTYLGSGVTVWYDFGTTGENFLIYFEQTVVQIQKRKVHLDVKIVIIDTNTIITLCYIIYEICFVFIVSVHK